MRANRLLEEGQPANALRHLEAAQVYPASLGEGKHLLTPEGHLHYAAGLCLEALGDSRGARDRFEQAAVDAAGLSVAAYFRGLALLKLGQEDEATAAFTTLLEGARRRLEKTPALDYFATSLPNFLLFEDDLVLRHRVECLFLIGLAQLGLGRKVEARETLAEVLALDVNHLAAAEELKRL